MIGRCRRTSPRERPRRSSSGRRRGPRVPRFDAALGREVTVGDGRARKHRLVVIGDSLTHGFQSGAIFNTELVLPARSSRASSAGTASASRATAGPARAAGQHRVPPARPRAALRRRDRPVGAAGGAAARAGADGRDRGLLGARRGGAAAGGRRDQARAGGLRLRPARRAGAQRRALRARDQDAERRPLRPDRRALPPARGAARPPARRRRGEADDVPRRGAGARRGRRDRDAGRLPRLQQRARRGHRPQARLERRRLPRPGGEERLHGLAPVALRRRVRRAGSAGGAHRRAARDLGDRAARHDRAARPRRRRQARHRGSRYFPYYTRPWIDDDDFDPRRRPAPHRPRRRAPSTTRSTPTTTRSRPASARARDAGRDWYLLEIAGMLDRLAHRRYHRGRRARARRGGRRTRSRRRCARCARRPTRAS